MEIQLSSLQFASKLGGYENVKLIHTHTMNAKMKPHEVCVCGPQSFWKWKFINVSLRLLKVLVHKTFMIEEVMQSHVKSNNLLMISKLHKLYEID